MRTRLPDGSRAIVAGYRDGTQSFFIAPDGTVRDAGRHSQMGVSIRRDAVGSWEPRPPLRPPLFTRRIRELQADPWLVTDESQQSVWYSFLAVIDRAGDPNALAVARSDDGGLSWGPAYPFLDNGIDFDEGPVTILDWQPAVIDKPSIDVQHDGSESYIAFVTPGFNDVRVQIVTEGAESTELAVIATNGFPLNPIVRVDPENPNRVLVAFQEARVNGSGFAIRIAVSSDFGRSFRVADVTDPDEGLVPAVVRGAMDLRVRNGIFMHYESAGSNLHYIVYESDGVVFARFSPFGVVWSGRTQLSTSAETLLDFQPTIAALPGDTVAVGYYEQARGTANTSFVAMVLTPGLGVLGGPTFLTRDSGGTPITFEPCPTLQSPIFGHYFGDYVGLVPLETGRFYAAWTDSRDGCVEATRLRALHHNIVGASF